MYGHRHHGSLYLLDFSSIRRLVASRHNSNGSGSVLLHPVSKVMLNPLLLCIRCYGITKEGAFTLESFKPSIQDCIVPCHVPSFGHLNELKRPSEQSTDILWSYL